MNVNKSLRELMDSPSRSLINNTAPPQRGMNNDDFAYERRIDEFYDPLPDDDHHLGQKHQCNGRTRSL